MGIEPNLNQTHRTRTPFWGHSEPKRTNPNSLTTEPEPNYQTEWTELSMGGSFIVSHSYYDRLLTLSKLLMSCKLRAGTGYWVVYWCDSFATVVCLSFKHLTFVDSEEREEAYTQMRSKIDSLASFASEDSRNLLTRKSKWRKWFAVILQNSNCFSKCVWHTSRTGTVSITASDRLYHATVLAGAKQ